MGPVAPTVTPVKSERRDFQSSFRLAQVRMYLGELMQLLVRLS
jgi:hypothetical protein